MLSKIAIIIKREYLERVKKKSFIITTILMPVIMLALMATPALIMMFSEGSETKVSVIDDSGVIAPMLKSTDKVKIEIIKSTVDEARTDADSYDALLYIPTDILQQGATIDLYTNGASSMLTEKELATQVDKAVETLRIKDYKIDNLDEILAQVQSSVNMRNFRIDKDDNQESSTMLSYFLGIVLTMLLYMCLLIYGQMVMTSIIEEKTNRVLEIVVSSVKPMQLMLGKICGIGLVAVTQIVLWGVLTASMSAFVLPMLVPADLMAQTAAPGVDTDIVSAISMLGNVGYIIQLFSYLLAFLIGGFMLYAAVYAAIGSAVDNIQDASQLQSVVVMPIIIGILVAMSAATDPNSGLAFWTSIIPFTSPMVMMARVPFGIPGWEVAVSLVVLYASFFAMVWFAAKIYRIGIFMYGKKPSLKELVKWARYK